MKGAGAYGYLFGFNPICNYALRCYNACYIHTTQKVAPSAQQTKALLFVVNYLCQLPAVHWSLALLLSTLYATQQNFSTIIFPFIYTNYTLGLFASIIEQMCFPVVAIKLAAMGTKPSSPLNRASFTS